MNPEGEQSSVPRQCYSCWIPVKNNTTTTTSNNGRQQQRGLQQQHASVHQQQTHTYVLRVIVAFTYKREESSLHR
ncbi:unnamed protein product [Laminaria digitata]